MTDTDRPDPYSAIPLWRPDPPCGRLDCPCAVPRLPCRQFEGAAETGPWCPCCGWNEAAHEVTRRARHLRVQRWRDARPAVATVRWDRSERLWIARLGMRTISSTSWRMAVDEARRRIALTVGEAAGPSAETVRVGPARAYVDKAGSARVQARVREFVKTPGVEL